MDELVVCEVSVKDSSIDGGVKPDIIVTNSTICGNASKTELIVPDFVTPASGSKHTTIKKEKDENTPYPCLKELLLPRQEKTAIKEERISFLDSDISESDSQLSESELKPQKSIQSEYSILASYLNPNKRRKLQEDFNPKPGTSIQPTMRERELRFGKAESSSTSVCSQDNPNDSDFGLHGSEDSSGFGPYGSQEGLSRLGEGGSRFSVTNTETFPSSDELLYCVDCKCAYEGDCPEHGPLLVVVDTYIPSNASDNTRAARTAPREVKIEGPRRVVSLVIIPNRTRFGPLQGKMSPSEVVNEFTRPIYKYGRHIRSLDSSDSAISNWMRFVRRTEDDLERNLDAYQFKGQIFFRTIREILPGEELVVGNGTSQGVNFCEKGPKIEIEEPIETPNEEEANRVLICVKCSTDSEYLGLITTHQSGYQCWCWTCLAEADFNRLSITLRGSKPYECCTCKKTFVRKRGLLDHFLTHTGEKPYSCPNCSRRFSVECALKRHLLVHTGEKPYGCTLCDQQFARSSDRTRHMRIHTGEKPFECTECSQRFNQKVHLQLHLRTHTGEKPFVCSDCNQRFAQNSHYLSHLRTHTGERPYVCDECDRRFVDFGHLNRHKRIHTGEKPFACSECGKAFSDNRCLKKHMIVHNQEEPAMQSSGLEDIEQPAGESVCTVPVSTI